MLNKEHITIYDNDNSQTIEDDFIVINTDNDFVIWADFWNQIFLHKNNFIKQM